MILTVVEKLEIFVEKQKELKIKKMMNCGAKSPENEFYLVKK